MGLTLEVTLMTGPVPVKRHGIVALDSLPEVLRGEILEALRGMSEGVKSGRPAPDVGSCQVRIDDAGNTVREIRFDEASATSEQAALAKLLRPLTRIVPWK